MSNNHFKTLLSILKDFPFTFEFSTPVWYMKDPKAKNTGKKEDMYAESGLQVSYGKVEFKVMFPGTFNEKQQSELLTILETSPNYRGGTIPGELKGIEVVTENSKPVYKVTNETVYFDCEIFEVMKGNIDLTGDYTQKGKKVTCEGLPGWELVKHDKKGKHHPGISFLLDGFLISVGTKEWKESPEKDPVELFINKVRELKPEELENLKTSVLETRKKEKERILKGRTGNPTKTTETPQKKTLPEPVQVPGKIEKPGNFIVSHLTRKDKDPETLIFQSWGVERLKIDTKDPGNPFVSFFTNGFIWEGMVKVIFGVKSDLFTVELIHEGETLVSIDKIQKDELQTVVDHLVEFDGDQESYELNVKELNGPTKANKAA